jgi:hypothetical protein
MPHVVPHDVVDFINRSVPPDINIFVADSNVGPLVTVMELTERIPEHLLQLDTSEFAALIAAMSALKVAVDSFRKLSMRDKQTQNTFALSPIVAFGNLTPLRILRDQLAKCPDQVPAPGTAQLNFIPDLAQRDTLRTDLGTVATALSHDEWKAATILSGSLIEALLLWAIKLHTNDIPNAIAALVGRGDFSRAPDAGNPDAWNLFQYIHVAREMNEIESQTADVVDAVRDFRNLIHPGLSIRSGQSCTRGTAHTAYGGLQLVIEDLSKRHP